MYRKHGHTDVQVGVFVVDGGETGDEVCNCNARNSTDHVRVSGSLAFIWVTKQFYLDRSVIHAVLSEKGHDLV